MIKFTLRLNKKYIISTFGSIYLNKIIEVIGIINYDEVKRSNFDVRVLALNEKIIHDDFDSYFKNMEFYKCRVIDSSEIIVLWPDIIDGSRTSIVEETYHYRATLKLRLPTSVDDNITPEKIIREELIAKAAEMGGELEFNLVSGDDNSVVDILRKRLDECQNVLRSLQGLSVITPTLDKLVSEDLTKKINTINNNINVINERIETIATGLS